MVRDGASQQPPNSLPAAPQQPSNNKAGQRHAAPAFCRATGRMDVLSHGRLCGGPHRWQPRTPRCNAVSQRPSDSGLRRRCVRVVFSLPGSGRACCWAVGWWRAAGSLGRLCSARWCSAVAQVIHWPSPWVAVHNCYMDCGLNHSAVLGGGAAGRATAKAPPPAQPLAGPDR